MVHALAVYDGRRHLGEVLRLRNGQYRALTADGGVAGTFDTIAAAQAAIAVTGDAQLDIEDAIQAAVGKAPP